jgi:endonuclease/exonuclease/phosphatase family metal-dependent hydrolase
MKRITSILFLLIAFNCKGQTNYEVKIMSWNVLNWPTSNTVTDTSFRCPGYRTVVNYAQPDILVTTENTDTTSSPWFRDQVMNTGIYHYEYGTFINGYDSDNAIYYRDSLFEFVSNVPIATALRDISHYTLIFKSTGDTLHIFSLHLKASQGYELERGQEIAQLRQVTNAFPAGTNFLVAGDFNIYESNEPAYVGLLDDNISDDGHVNDPLHLTGVWNHAIYAPYHTQSTRFNSGGIGGGSGGGMNDRFDMILYSNGIEQPTGMYYIPGTYANIGNDGSHYDQAVNFGPNSSVPDDVADALFDVSDHLPVTLKLMIGPTAGIEELKSSISDVEVFPVPVTNNFQVRFSVRKKSEVQFLITDQTGRLVYATQSLGFEPGEKYHSFDLKNELKPGFYFLSVKFDNNLISKKIILFD